MLSIVLIGCLGVPLILDWEVHLFSHTGYAHVIDIKVYQIIYLSCGFCVINCQVYRSNDILNINDLSTLRDFHITAVFDVLYNIIPCRMRQMRIYAIDAYGRKMVVSKAFDK